MERERFDLLAEKRVRRAGVEPRRGQRWLALNRGRMVTARFMAKEIDSMASKQAMTVGQTLGFQAVRRSPEIDGLGGAWRALSRDVTSCWSLDRHFSAY